MDSFQCNVCGNVFNSLRSHAHHQKCHSNDHNFFYQCGEVYCVVAYSSFKALNDHISKCHVQPVVSHGTSTRIKCLHCEESVNSMKDLCHHLQYVHVRDEGLQNVMCPFADCSRDTPVTSVAIFAKHLSQQHPGWKDYSETSGATAATLASECSYSPGGNDAYPELGGNEDDNAYDFSLYDDEIIYQENEIFKLIGKFYIMLESDCNESEAAVNRVAQNIAVLSEMCQSLMRNSLITELKKIGVSDDNIEDIVCKFADSNPLLLAHHKHLRGPSFVTDHLRKKYYTEEFKIVLSEEKNLSEDPLEKEAYQYVPIKKTLASLVMDKSVQKEILLSFERFGQNPRGDALNKVYLDYTDGDVCIRRNLPPKRLDLLLFQDGFSATSMMTTVQQKHKRVGAYMTLGNLRPHLRTKLKSIQLVIMIGEKLVKKYRQLCFRKLVDDLKSLQSIGFDFMGEVIPVYLQFNIGDNLGAHFAAGLVECFTAKYPCRYCPITLKEIRTTPGMLKPLRTQMQYDFSVSIVENSGLNNHRGVKENSIFNELEHFKVCDPGFPPCIGHDLFHGVVNYDFSVMIRKLVGKHWFSYETLNRRIATFKYFAADSKNKPAPVKPEGLKLGGSAVQNWTLLRLFPLIIEGLIKDPNDALWLLYLKLKRCSEYICAPAINENQIDSLDILLEQYMIDREVLGIRGRPKHHYLREAARLIRKFGPLIHLWGMRFEAKHQFFKRVARSANNFINLDYTLAYNHQLHFAYLSTGPRYPDTVSKCVSKPFECSSCRPEVSAVIASQPGLSHNEMQDVQSLKFNQLTYKKGDYIILGGIANTENLVVARTEQILLDNGRVYFILSKKVAQFQPSLGLHFITESQAGESTVFWYSEILLWFFWLCFFNVYYSFVQIN